MVPGIVIESRTRTDGRNADALRPVRIETGIQKNPEGSVMITCGGTKVLVAASVEEGVKDFLAGSNRGWVTGEYAMHPRANPERQRRERNNIGGRTHEIQRLIGRALRAAVHLEKLGERTICIDCDVLDADGGTRTASVTGGFVALVLALDSLRKRGLLQPGVLREPVADHGVRHGVRDELALRRVLLRQAAQLGVALDVGAEDDARRDRGDVEPLGEPCRLGPLAGALGAHDDQACVARRAGGVAQRRNPS